MGSTLADDGNLTQKALGRVEKREEKAYSVIRQKQIISLDLVNQILVEVGLLTI